MKTKTVVILASLLLMISVSAVAYAQNSSNNVVTDQNIDELKKMNIKINDNTDKSFNKVEREVAVNKAREKFPGWANNARSIKVEYHLLTNPDFTNFSKEALEKNQKLRETGFMVDQPVYIVTYEGLSIVGHVSPDYQGDPPINHEYNVVVDATSGEPLMAFSYR